jgi:uncharacterized protein YcbK (DUF882 family)
VKHLLTTVIRSFAVFFAGTMLCLSTIGQAAAEVRTISLYHVHTRESLTVTYKKDGRYIPSAMAQINYILRDWRKNRPTTMAPETIDLMWELHEDLGSKQPIRIICGYRSAETNAMLKKIGRKVARQSQHISGKAVDLYFPDVPLERVRNSALVRQVGGVGYYPARGGGFIHVDNGHVRHWPRISPTKLAQIYGEYARTVGARSKLGPTSFQVAAAESKFTTAPKSAAAAIPPVADEGDDDENGARSADLREEDFESYTPAPKAVAKAETPPEPVVPRPRPKPIEVLMLAAANMQIEPASAPVDKPNFAERPVTMQESLGPVNADANLVGERDLTSNIAAKGSFAMELISASTKDAPMIRPLTEGSSDVTWHASLMSASRLVRRDGSPQPFGRPDAAAPAQLTAAKLPAVQLAHTRVLSAMSGALVSDGDRPTSAGTGKGDMLEVNRDGKRDLTDPGPAPPPKAKLSAIDQFLGLFSSRQ